MEISVIFHHRTSTSIKISQNRSNPLVSFFLFVCLNPLHSLFLSLSYSHTHGSTQMFSSQRSNRFQMRLILYGFLVLPFSLLPFISFSCFSFSALIFSSSYCLPLRLYTVSLTLSVLLFFIFSISLYLPLLFLIFLLLCFNQRSLSHSLFYSPRSSLPDLSLCSLSLARGQSVTVMFGGEQRASDG